ncbi:MAG: hypothetical protein Kow00121_60520 [Elainellaceae cyanobacterium]
MFRKVATVLSIAVLGVGVVAGEAKAYTSTELNFLSAVRNGVGSTVYSDVLSGLTDSSLLEMAYATCSALNNGESISSIADGSRNRVEQSDLPAYSRRAVNYIIGYTIASGIEYFCPQHYSQLVRFVEVGDTAYAPSSTLSTSRQATGYWGTLTATDPGSQINVRSTPSLNASAPHYGLVGDRVWITRAERHDGYNWYFVGFPDTNATGWVRGDFVDVDHR